MRKHNSKRRNEDPPCWRICCLVIVVALILTSNSTRATDLNGKSEASPTLLSSLWQTFKQTMEMTSGALYSSQKSAAMAEPERVKNTRLVLSSRRIVLVRKALRDHYTKHFVNSFPHWDNYHTKEKEEASHDTKVQSNTRQANRRPLRWKDDSENGCHLFSESAGDYWSFQWCPRGVVLQGFRTDENRLLVQHFLGTYVPISQAGSIGFREDAQKFARDARLQYPNAHQLELYHNGDPCGTKGSMGALKQRMTVVVYHERNSLFCAGDWAESLADLTIESVEEARECRYIIHICGPVPTFSHKTASSQDKETDTESYVRTEQPMKEWDAQILNQTISKIQHDLLSYLKESSADTRRKSNPDRTTSLHIGLPPLPQSRIQSNLKLLQNMFQHAYDSYMYHAFPASDIKPLTCQPASFDLVKIPGLTLIDSLDTLIVFGNYTEFARAVERLRALHLHEQQQENGKANGRGGLFALDQNVSVFETNIRVLGGLLSAHQLAEAHLSKKVLTQNVWSHDDKTVLVGPTAATITPQTDYCASDKTKSDSSNVDPSSWPNQCSVAPSLFECRVAATSTPRAKATCGNNTVKYWAYDGILLELAQDIGNRLLPAFETKTGIPYGTVNLLSGIPQGETTIASLAGGGTLSLEMELLSRLTGNPEYGKAAKLATRALWMRRSGLDLVGKHICTHRGEWTETLSGIGSNSDSFYEYLIKHHTLFPEDDDFWLQLVSTYGGIYNESRLGEWYGDVDYHRGQSNGGGARRVFEALMAFYPGMQVLLGELIPAARSLNSFFLVREHLGFLPERFNYASWKVDNGGGHHFLRPELMESAYFQHRASKGFQQQFRNSSTVDSSGWQWAVDFALHALEESTKTTCGYASLRSVSPKTTGDIRRRDGNKISNNLINEMPSFFLSETLKYLYLIFDDNNILHTDTDRDWVFTTEAHPIHHVDAHRGDEKQDALVKLKDRLVERLKARVQGKSSGESAQSGLNKEKWTESSSSQKYLQQAMPVAIDVDNKSRSQLMASERTSHGPAFWKTSHLVEPLLFASPVSSEVDFFKESLQKENAAHLTFGRLGNRLMLTNSCPNFYLPDWRWICALNGGGADYSDAYVSSATDEPTHGESHFHMVGSIDALAFLGSGVHVAEMYDSSRKCPIVQQQEKAQGKGSPRSQDVGNSMALFDMGGELGQFEVSVFPEGSGFFVHRTSSGETIAATLIYDELSQEPEKPYVMVHASTPVDSKTSKGNIDEALSDGKSVEKSVVMADIAGNAFFCQVEVVVSGRTATSKSDEGLLETRIVQNADGGTEDVIASYPCAPAMFGPAHMVELIARDGFVIESSLIRRPDGKHGCQIPSTDADGEIQPSVTAAGSISLVHRGLCTFAEKALTQKNFFHAKAVIVVNSEDEELFVMSGGGSGRAGPTTSADFPPTVLITGNDGKDLLFQTESTENVGNSQLVVRISITRDHAHIIEKDRELSVRDSIHWPAVRARPDAVQIFAKGGWAIQAMQRNVDVKSSASEWQLYLMPHKVLAQSEDPT